MKAATAKSSNTCPLKLSGKQIFKYFPLQGFEYFRSFGLRTKQLITSLDLQTWRRQVSLLVQFQPVSGTQEKKKWGGVMGVGEALVSACARGKISQRQS